MIGLNGDSALKAVSREQCEESLRWAFEAAGALFETLSPSPALP
jgi:hypothetical protein